MGRMVLNLSLFSLWKEGVMMFMHIIVMIIGYLQIKKKEKGEKVKSMDGYLHANKVNL